MDRKGKIKEERSGERKRKRRWKIGVGILVLATGWIEPSLWEDVGFVRYYCSLSLSFRTEFVTFPLSSLQPD